MSTDTTTIEIKTDVWAALDRRKDRGESFDDVIRRLIDATPVGVGELQVSEQVPETTELIPVDDEAEECVYYDVIAGESCGRPAKYKHQWRYDDTDAWRWFYYCSEHAGDTHAVAR